MIEKEMDEAPVLILEGGAMRGLFTAGVLDAFMDHRFYFKKAAGISAGTLQGHVSYTQLTLATISVV